MWSETSVQLRERLSIDQFGRIQKDRVIGCCGCTQVAGMRRRLGRILCYCTSGAVCRVFDFQRLSGHEDNIDYNGRGVVRRYPWFSFLVFWKALHLSC